ncbi:MAG: hypothetical protein UT41_C0002G0008 [Candidatus Wolfebacteria bacterium GW2011_GWC2_39_22]|uniref:TrbC/VIRB2 family protein n=1 Tax=Candidatus Wolfebacteria bacterium GW2011_GWC2_39_22 TaxID=1619013 RepID=A0A0G0N7V6_9BACT|nr:MAG: hypothetical protein UT41_C0002G0008 [Candidatus Wolfebacteria bacterium GW2011_GWC2_39_22]HBI25869.1 hypothetical protein [Candidatus Wolfebacteria bacterium]
MYKILATILSFPLFASTVFAVGGTEGDTTPNAPVGSSVKFTGPLGDATLTDVLNRVIDYSIAIAASLAAIMILYGAFQIMTAQGESKKIVTGRQTIVYALSGLVIIILARGLVAIFKGLVIGLGA